jgi:hypothetical protein
LDFRRIGRTSTLTLLRRTQKLNIAITADERPASA